MNHRPLLTEQDIVERAERRAWRIFISLWCGFAFFVAVGLLMAAVGLLVKWFFR